MAAVQALRATGLPGTAQIGLWGISRAGWIAPLAIQAEPSIAFWISVSGVDDKENARYLLESNLPIEGRSAEETARVVGAWQQGFNAVWKGGSYQ
ncbi:MAG: alpha/beta hydrolase, partial [Bacteroidota bacterium]